MTYHELPANGRNDWLKQRHDGIGASEAAAVMGRSPWTSPFDLYWRKRSAVDDGGENEYTSWGHRLEPVIAAHFAGQHPELHARTAVGLCVNDARSWQRCSPDGLLFEASIVRNRGAHGGPAPEPLAGLEVKNAHNREDWDEPDLQGIPLHYYDQVQWSMDVTGLPVWWVAVLFGGNTYAEYEVAYDDLHAKALREQGDLFWQSIVEQRPPPIDAHDATARRLRVLHPDVEDVQVQVDDELAEYYRLACEMVKAATKEKKQAENELRNAIGDGRVAVTSSGSRVASRSVYTVDRIDVSELRKAHPALVCDYLKQTTVHKITPARRP